MPVADLAPSEKVELFVPLGEYVVSATPIGFFVVAGFLKQQLSFALRVKRFCVLPAVRAGIFIFNQARSESLLTCHCTTIFNLAVCQLSASSNESMARERVWLPARSSIRVRQKLNGRVSYLIHEATRFPGTSDDPVFAHSRLKTVLIAVPTRLRETSAIRPRSHFIKS